MSASFTADEFASGVARGHFNHLAVTKLEAGERGIWISVPALSVIEHGTIPLVGCYVTRPGAPDAPPFERHAILVACDLDTNEVYVAPAFAPPDELEPVPKAGGQAMTGFGFSLELGERLQLPARTGRYALWMIVREWVSPPVVFRRAHDPGEFHDYEAEEFLRRMQAERGPGPIFPPPGRPLPRYGEAAGALEGEPPGPEIPDQGVALELPRVSFVDQSVVVRGSFRVRARVQERCPPEPAPTHGPDERGPSAIVGVGLVVTASDQIGPQVHELALPSYTRFHASETLPVVSGRFAFDWLALPEVWDTPRTYFIYVVADGRLGGPHKLALVTRDMVPGAR